MIGWSGDIIQLNSENGDKWEFVLPESGGTLWSDNMMIPIGSPHKKNAETLIELLLRPEGRRRGRRLRELHLPGAGRPGGDEEDRQGPGDEPADLPDDAELAKVQVFTKLDRRGGDEVHAGVPEGAGA